MLKWLKNLGKPKSIAEPVAEVTAPESKPAPLTPVPLWTHYEDGDRTENRTGDESWFRKPITIGDTEMLFVIDKSKYGYRITNNDDSIIVSNVVIKSLKQCKKLVNEYIAKCQQSEELKKDKSKLILKWTERSENINDRHKSRWHGMDEHRSEKKPVYENTAYTETKFGAYRIECQSGNYYGILINPEPDTHPLVDIHRQCFKLERTNISSGNDTKNTYEFCLLQCEKHYKQLLKDEKKKSLKPTKFPLPATTKIMIPTQDEWHVDPRIVFEDERLFPTHKQITLKKSEIERIRIPNEHDIDDLKEYFRKTFEQHREDNDDEEARNKLPYMQKIALTNRLQKRYNDYIDTWRIVDISAKGIKLEFLVISATEATLQELSEYIWDKPNFKEI